MSLSLKRLMNDLEQLKKDPLQNCSANPIDNKMDHWKATIFGPEGTPYHGGVFELELKFTKDYPFKPPKVRFVTPIYHCNINKRGGICLDILKNDWSPALSVSSVLLSICSLLSQPDPKDSLEHSKSNLYKNDRIYYDNLARKYTIRYAGTEKKVLIYDRNQKMQLVKKYELVGFYTFSNLKRRLIYKKIT